MTNMLAPTGPCESFAKHLYERLTTDKYGNWTALGDDVLRSLCERMEDEALDFFDLTESDEVVASLDRLQDEFNDLQVVYDGVCDDVNRLEGELIGRVKVGLRP